MKSLGLTTVLAASQLATAKEMRDPPKQARYESGEMHASIMSRKEASWAAQRAAGLWNPSRYTTFQAVNASADAYVPCVDGVAEVVPGDGLNTFRCNNIDFYDFKTHADLGSIDGGGSSSWGWRDDSSGREFVAIAQSDGAAFAEVTAAGKLLYLGRLPQYPSAAASIWREIRGGLGSLIVIGSEAVGHGVQVFDMARLVGLDPTTNGPVTFDPAADLVGHFDGLPVGRTHNVVVNAERGYAVAVGASPRSDACASGLIFIDLTNPAAPSSPGCAAGDGYVHDAQCLVYRGPDEKYNGTDICYGYNEDTLTIYNVTDMTGTHIISRTSYDGASYTHQGWVADPDWQQFLLLDDEYDEYDQAGSAADGYPVTYFWDISSLEAPVLSGFYKSTSKGIDHNQFVVDGLSYQSNYATGLRILDVSSLHHDPTGAGVTEVGFFDIYPEDDDDPLIDFVGTWSNYPYFVRGSGYIVINTIERGAFVVKRSHL